MLIPIEPNIFLVVPPGRGKFPYCYSVLFKDKLNAVIDTGFGEEDLAQLHKDRVDIIINTHFHRDHIKYNHQFPDAVVWAHYQDAPCIRSLETFIHAFGCHLLGGEEVGRQYFESVNIIPSPVHRELNDGELLALGKTRLQVVHTPGHTPGHCAFWEEKHGILISGDIDLAGFGPWYAHDCSDLDDLLASIEKCREIKPRLLVTAHKGVISENIDSGLTAFKDVVLRREEKILKLLRRPHTIDELATYQLCYGQQRQLSPLYQWFEKMAVCKHLQRLQRKGIIKESEGLYQHS
jgi:glyoxylase-like metal-dependent hydrolase (beta-lactamase superfamily II)